MRHQHAAPDRLHSPPPPLHSPCRMKPPRACHTGQVPAARRRTQGPRQAGLLRITPAERPGDSTAGPFNPAGSAAQPGRLVPGSKRPLAKECRAGYSLGARHARARTSPPAAPAAPQRPTKAHVPRDAPRRMPPPFPLSRRACRPDRGGAGGRAGGCQERRAGACSKIAPAPHGLIVARRALRRNNGGAAMRFGHC